LNKIVQWTEVLRTKDDLDQIKTKVLFELGEALNVRNILMQKVLQGMVF
jgi:hypothetical protein